VRTQAVSYPSVSTLVGGSEPGVGFTPNSAESLDLGRQEARSLDLRRQEARLLDLERQEVQSLDLGRQEARLLDLGRQEVRSLELGRKEVWSLDLKRLQDKLQVTARQEHKPLVSLWLSRTVASHLRMSRSR
jgi:hypothetical protein